MTYWTKKHTLEFIDIYRTKECLWKHKNKDYTNKTKRDKAYDDLIAFVRTFYEGANRDTVVNKITNLRSSWRKQYKKSKLSGAIEDEFYEPSLFYYDSLSFISNSWPDSGIEGLDPIMEQHYQDAGFPEETTPSEDRKLDYDDPASGRSSPSTSASHFTPVLSACRETSRKRKDRSPKRMKTSSSLEDDLLLLACQKLGSSSSETREKDDFDLFGQTVANDLRSMSREQYFHAKKLISDVLYEGNLDNLSRASHVFTAQVCFPNQCPQPDSMDVMKRSPASIDDEQY